LTPPGLSFLIGVMDFDQRLEKAIQRGQRRGDAQALAEAARTVNEEELRRLHSQYRLELSEHIERCIRSLLQHFPGFQVETVYGERGWGAACRRDDVRLLGRGQRENYYSRLEMTVRPYSSLRVLEVAAKGTVLNKELLTRQHYEPIADVDLAKFLERIDSWTLEFAELYAARC
jgi:hypothetical protein